MSDLAPDIARGAHPLVVGSMRGRGLGWWGVLCVIATEGALFGYLLFSYYYLEARLGGNWIPEPNPSLKLSLPNTIILLISSMAVWWGDQGCKKGRHWQHVGGIGLGFLLGVIFLVIQVFEWKSKTYSLRTGPYGSIFFTVTGFHTAHVLAGVIILLALLVWSFLGYFSPRRSAPVLIGSLYWHFVDAVWLAVFFTFYITPYLGWR